VIGNFFYFCTMRIPSNSILKFMKYRFITIFCVVSCLQTSWAEVSVNAEFSPNSIQLGDVAKYIITITETSDQQLPQGERVTSLPIPMTGGLDLRNGRIGKPSTRTTIINTQVTYSLSQQLIIEAHSDQTGRYTIPSFSFEYKGQDYVAPAATLTIVERSANSPPPLNQLIFLKAELPETLYVGQTYPIKLKLYAHEQVRYRGYDDFNRMADGFTISDLPEPTEATEIVNGYRYLVFTWPLTITPIQTGPQPLNFEFSVVAQIPSNQNRNSTFGRNSPFGSSIFDDFFGRSERFNLFTDLAQIEVLPLPNEGKPDSFSGAIGDFNMQVYADQETTRQGEPIMLSVRISGAGNFGRISGPQLAENSNWRSYDPETIMETEDPLTTKGIKRFDYVFIPNQEGQQQLPEVNFSYFDPTIPGYVELNAPPIPIKVTKGNQTVMPATTAEAPEVSADSVDLPIQQKLSPEELLLTLDYRPTSARDQSLSILYRPAFYTFNSLVFVVLCTLAFILRNRYKLLTNADFAVRRDVIKALKQELARANKAVQQNDTDAFYRSAQNTIRLATTKRTGRNLRSANLSELDQAFEQLNLNASIKEMNRELFESADSLRFSSASPDTDLQSAHEQFNRIIKSL